MTVIIHDLDNKHFEGLFPYIGDNIKIVSETKKIQHCIGCFGCWIKTPGKCILKDGYDNMGEILSQSDKVIIISKCYYGGYSPFVKNILDRSISYLLPFFQTKKDETHHKQRYKKTLSLFVYFYSEHISEKEKVTAQSLVKANSKNFYVSDYKISFYNSINHLCEKVSLQ